MLGNLKSIDATKGKLLGSIILYSLPLMFSALIQTLFSAVDVAVLGFAADDVAVASVGATTAIISLLINTFYGLSGGARVILARLLGEKNAEKVKKTVDTVIILVFGIGLFATVTGVVLADWFLQLTKCPASCFAGASLYLRIYIFSAPAMLLYNCGSAIISVDGDTQRPMLYIIATGGIKVVLNLLLCWLLPNKVLAVAIATLIANYFSAVAVIVRLTHVKSLCRLHLRQLQFSASAMRSILRFGIPSMIAGMILPISNLQIQTAINSFGTATIAGNTAVSNVENIVAAFSSSAFQQTAATFVGQNIGANQPKRVKKSVLYCLILGGGIGLVLGVGAYLFGEPLLGLFIPGEYEAIGFGMIRGKYLLTIYWMITATLVFSATVTAFGYNITASAVNLITVIGTRLLWMQFVFPKNPTHDCLYLCFTISWAVMFLLFAAIFLYLYFFRYKKGRIGKI